MTREPTRLTIAVLAGGLATRLGEIARETPKALLEVHGRPFLAWQLELFARSGIARVVLCVGHHGDQIERWVGQHAPAGLEVRVSYDGPVALGTGGAIRQALPLLEDPFLVVYGDSYLRCDYRAVFEHFVAERERARQAPLGLMTVFENEDAWDRSNVVFRAGEIVQYDKRVHTPEMRHIDWGLGVFTPAAFEAFEGRAGFDLAEVYQHLVAERRLLGVEVRDRFYEIGSRDGLEEFRRYAQALAPKQC
jgi:NDP-sugar pyrophosphorylase family protein